MYYGPFSKIFGHRKPAHTGNGGVESETHNTQQLGEEGIPRPLRGANDERLNRISQMMHLQHSHHINLDNPEQMRSIMRDRDATLRALRRKEKNYEADKEKCKKRISSLEQNIASAEAQVTVLTNTLKEKDADLQCAENKIAAQEKKLLQDGGRLQRAYANAVSVLAQEVSREVPDDVIRNELKSFFQGDFLSWCAEMCTRHVVNKRGTFKTLQPWDVLNPNLSFDFDLSAGRSAFLLLQAVLSRFLCTQFLTHAYFLAADPNGFLAIERALAAETVAASVDWRIQTVQCLETTGRLDAVYLVWLFENHFGFLLHGMDQGGRENLATIITRFAQLSIKLWKVRATIHAVGVTGFAERTFKLGDDYTECEAQLLSERGDQLNGRPIGAILQPLILAYPVAEGNGQAVVWSKALVWV